jgi:hypothetical protein
VAIRTGLAGAVVQRSIADWPVVLAAWLLLVCATTLLATGVVYGDAVATSGLHRALLAAPPATRALDVLLTAEPAAADRVDPPVRAELARAMAATGGDVLRVSRTGSFATAGIPADQVTDLTVFESVDRLEDRSTLVAGAWPTAGQSPIEATVSEGAARAMHVAVGDRVSLESRLDANVKVDVVITGIRAVDPADALWLGEDLETTGTTAGGSFTTRGPLMVRDADLASLRGSTRLQVSWRGLPDINRLRIDGVEPLRNGANDLAARLRGVLPANAGSRVTTSLPALLDDVGRSVLVSRSGVILLTIQFAVLAGYAIVLVAGMLVERRRSELALLRSRGASAVHLIVMAVLESTLLAVPAAALAPILAVAVVGLLGVVGPTANLDAGSAATIGQGAIIVSALAGIACIVALSVPTVFVSASPAGAWAAQGRQARTTLAQRLGLDLALVVLAGVALWQLRLYGAPLTRNARGALGLDPLLVAAPAIGLVAGAVLALRVVPRIAELGEQLLIRSRGLVGSLGGRQLARRPLRYTRAALLLMLAAALGTLAAAHAATWTRSQTDQAAFQAAADVRANAADYSTLPTWAAGPRYRAIPGVEAAAPIRTVPFNVGRNVRDAELVGLDPASIRAVDVGSTAAGLADHAAAVDALAAATTPPPTLPLPAATRRLAVTIDSSFSEVDDANPSGTPLATGTPGLRVGIVLRDADGRLLRLPDVSGSLAALGQRLVIDLADPAAPGLQPAAPLSLEAVELMIAPGDPIAILGTAEIVRLEATSDAAGVAGWTTLSLRGDADGWAWDRGDGTSLELYTPPADRPNRITIDSTAPVFGGSGFDIRFRLLAMPPLLEGAASGGGSGTDGGGAPILPIIASSEFLTRTGSTVGDTLQLSSLGSPLNARIVATTSLFAPFDPATPFALTDLATLDLVGYATSGRTEQADEWWLRVQPGTEPAVLAALRDPGAGTASVVGREQLTRELTTDPVPLGLIGVLGLGSIAAMLFAGIGFLVSSTISTNERIGEFALLRALGLSTAQLSLWLSIESVFLLVVGLVAGSVLGLILAWLVLPFATLTQTGLAPIPAPVVDVPWTALVPPYVAAILLFVLSLWLVRRQLPDIRISGVLRARDG